MSRGAILRRRRAVGAVVDYAASVQTLLSGTAGFAFDPVVANLFQDTAGTTPVVSVSDPIGRMNCQWGTAPPNFTQSTAGYRPAWDGSGVSCDGVDDHMAALSSAALTTNVPGTFFCCRVQVSSLASTRALIAFANGLLATSQRFVLVVNTDGSLALQLRRLDADALTTVTSSAGAIVAGVAATVAVQADWAGTGLAKIWVDGNEVGSGAIAGAIGNTDVTNTLRTRLYASLNATPPAQRLTGWGRRFVFAPFAVSDANRANVQGWVGAL